MRDSNPRSPAGSKMEDEQIWKMNKNCKKSGPLRVRLSTEKKNKKKLLTVRVGLFSLREKAPTKKKAPPGLSTISALIFIFLKQKIH